MVVVARLSTAVVSMVGRARKMRGLTQQQLARLVGVSRQTIVELEGGGYNPSTALALRLAIALDTSADRLFALPTAEAEALRQSVAEVLPDEGEG
ncbi:MAG: helix-turn-helix transcriptional regulator [Sciscionella sp.]